MIFIASRPDGQKYAFPLSARAIPNSISNFLARFSIGSEDVIRRFLAQYRFTWRCGVGSGSSGSRRRSGSRGGDARRSGMGIRQALSCFDLLTARSSALTL